MGGHTRKKTFWGYVSCAAIGFVLGCAAFVVYLFCLDRLATLTEEPDSPHSRLVVWKWPAYDAALWGIAFPPALALAGAFWPRRLIPNRLNRWPSAAVMVALDVPAACACYVHLLYTCMHWMWLQWD